MEGLGVGGFVPAAGSTAPVGETVALRVALRALFASKTAHSVAQVIGARSSQVEGFAVKSPEHSQNPEAPEGT